MRTESPLAKEGDIELPQLTLLQASPKEPPLTMPEHQGQKRARLSENASPLIPPDAVPELINCNRWIEGQWLNDAVGSICQSQGPGVGFVDSLELSKMVARDGSDYQLQPRVAIGPNGVLRSNIVILPVSVSENHWCLGLIRKSGDVVEIVGLHDSLPSSRGLELVQQVFNVLIEKYLPETPAIRRKMIPLLTPTQPNTDDCGIYAFAMSLFVLADRQPPTKLHGKLWRRIFAACVGAQDIA